ncbi:Hypothetical protein ACI5QL_00448 [Bacillus velezensis]
MENYPKEFPAESQKRQPGIENEMNPAPVYEYKEYKGADKLKGKTALITGATAVSDGPLQSLTRRKAQMSRSSILMNTVMRKIQKNEWKKKA